jgi:hypothetical protein
MSDEIKLKIVNFGDDKELNTKVREYFGLFVDYCKRTGAYKDDGTVLHIKNGLRRV